MKKVFLSAFAMSLILISTGSKAQTNTVDEFLGLEALPIEFHDGPSWNVTPEKVVKDLPRPIKGQKHSIIQWNDLDPVEWTSFDHWKKERLLKDEVPDWKIRVRISLHKEVMGKVLSCTGTCYSYRGTNKAHIQHLSTIEEGDEIHTDDNSVAWIYFMDGSLMRVSPKSSVSLQEINLSTSEIQILVRLNEGHIFWNPRLKNDQAVVDAPETDTLSVPLLVKEANLEAFEREIFKNATPEEKVLNEMTFSEEAKKKQVEMLNSLRTASESAIKIPTKLMVVAPNASVVGNNTAFDFVHMIGGKSWFKKRSVEERTGLDLHLRGYAATHVRTVSENSWNEVETNGRSAQEIEDVPAPLQILELLTKRITTIELAREIWVKEFTLPVMKDIENQEKLSRDHGYGLWNSEDLSKRFNYLVEYTRRIETTNLRSVENLLTKIENNGEVVRKELDEKLYQASLNDYLLGLKNRYDSKKMRVKEMNDVQFHVWILKNGKW